MDWGKTGITTLREVLERIRLENRRAKKSKRELSHELANGFLYTLKDWVTVRRAPTGSANYFCIEIDSITLAVTPFGSHEEWWEKPSLGCRQMVREMACRWDVVLFHLPTREALWIEGPAFNKNVLKGREKVNSSEVHRARRARIANSFFESRELIELIGNPPKKPGDTYLVLRPRF